MIFCVFLSRERAAELHCDPTWAQCIPGWRAYGLTQKPGEVVMWVQTNCPILVVRSSFMLPRLFATTFDRMMAVLLDQHGLLTECVFSGGSFVRMLRTTRRNLLAAFDTVASAHREIIDLTADSPPLSVIPATE